MRTWKEAHLDAPGERPEPADTHKRDGEKLGHAHPRVHAHDGHVVLVVTHVHTWLAATEHAQPAQDRSWK